MQNLVISHTVCVDVGSPKNMVSGAGGRGWCLRNTLVPCMCFHTTGNSAVTNQATHLCKCNGMVDLLETHPPYMCYHAMFCHSALKGLRINRREPPKLGSAGGPPFGVGAWLTPKTKPSPIGVAMSNLIVGHHPLG